jgi:hypothetical protein
MRARELRQAAETREQHLDQLSRNENLAWQRIETAIQTKQQKQYDVAVSLLVDLRDLSVRSRKEADFHATLAKLRDTHERKPALLERLCKSGLLP